VDEDVFEALVAAEFEQGDAVACDGVDAFLLDEAHEVEIAAVGFGEVYGFEEGVVCEEVAVLDAFVYAREALVDYASGAYVEVSDLAVALVSLGQAYASAGGFDQHGGVVAFVGVCEGGFGGVDGV